MSAETRETFRKTRERNNSDCGSQLSRFFWQFSRGSAFNCSMGIRRQPSSSLDDSGKMHAIRVPLLPLWMEANASSARDATPA
jgi:hypothetical protein